MKSFLNLSDALGQFYNQFDVGNKVCYGNNAIATITEIGDNIKGINMFGKQLEWDWHGHCLNHKSLDLVNPIFTKVYKLNNLLFDITVTDGRLFISLFVTDPNAESEIFLSNNEATATKKNDSIIRIYNDKGDFCYEIIS